MARVEIKGTINIPSKKKLWLVKITGVNRKKFCGERGYILESKKQDYYRVEHYCYRNVYVISAIDEIDEEEANCTYEKIKMFGMTAKDISYRFSLFGDEIGAKTLKELEKKLIDNLKSCKKHIEKAKKAKIALEKLLKELHKEVD